MGVRAALHIVGGTVIVDRYERCSVLAAHLTHLRWRNHSTGTISQRRYALLRLARHADKDLLEVTSDDISVFRDRLTRAGQPLVAKSQSGELTHLRAFYKWAVLEELIDRDPTLRVPMPRLPRGLPHPIPEHELALAITTAAERVRPFYFLAAYAGLRACEIAQVRGEDIWWDQDPVLLVIRRGKGGDPGTVPVGAVLREELLRLPRKGWLAPRADGQPGPLMPHMVSHLANDHLHRVGSLHTLHSCRHRFGTMVYRLSGGDLRLTQEMMRHRSPVSTAIYTQVDQSHAAGVVSLLPAPTLLRVVPEGGQMRLAM